MRIYKYDVQITDEQEIALPVGARILTAQVQDNRLKLWTLVDEKDAGYQKVRVYVIATGNPVPPLEGMEYLATVQQFGGSLVWHVFVPKGVRITAGIRRST